MQRIWNHFRDADRALAGTTVLMLFVLAGSLAGLLLDPRTIAGAPAWLKPAKFAVSVAIYTLTLSWIFTYLAAFPRTRRVVGWATASAMLLEVVIIVIQAWRGTTSHFNVGTPLDAALWGAMGIAIAAQTLLSIAVAVALWRQRFQDQALGWALRLGMVITILGASSGGLMTGPTEQQLADAHAGKKMAVIGSHHTDGPGQEHGDLRVPHFLGIHAVEALPLLAFAIRRRWSGSVRIRLIQVSAASYSLLFAILLWQALRGQSVLHPDAETAAALIAWLLLTATGIRLAIPYAGTNYESESGLLAR